MSELKAGDRVWHWSGSLPHSATIVSIEGIVIKCDYETAQYGADKRFVTSKYQLYSCPSVLHAEMLGLASDLQRWADEFGHNPYKF